MKEDILTQKLLKYPSFKGNTTEISNFLSDYLSNIGFSVQHNPEKASDDICATIGQGNKHLLLAGYIDVLKVSYKDKEWKYPPFEGYKTSDEIYGRGAVSKGCISCAISAVEEILQEKPLTGRLSLFLSSTGAETLSSLKKTASHKIGGNLSNALCLCVMPQNNKRLGEKIGIGSRGCVVFKIKSFSQSGNPASQNERDNPLHNMIDFLFKIKTHPIDNGNEYFEPSTLQVVSIDSEGSKENAISEKVVATVCVYYNSGYTKEEIVAWMRKNMTFSKGQFELSYKFGAESYICKADKEVKLLKKSNEKVLGMSPMMSGSDIPNFASNLHNHIPILGYGLPAVGMHGRNESVNKNDLQNLKSIYKDFIINYLEL